MATEPTQQSEPTSPERKRVLIVDDHALLRGGWHQLIDPEPDLEICGEAASASDALRLMERMRPDIVVTDISLPGRSGLELIKDLRSLHPQVPVLVVSMHDERLYGERVLKAGGRGYLMKEVASEELITAIRQVLRGRPYVSQSLSEVFLRGMVAGTSPVFPLDRLTDRELEIFGLIGNGKSQGEIAKQLGIEPRTVEAHRAHIRKKLGLPDSNALLRFAVRWFETAEAAH